MRAPSIVDLYRPQAASRLDEAAAGLLAVPATVSPKFFYDALGSRLFDAITELDEYYPTRTEAAILARHGDALAAAVQASLGAGCPLVDLGAGNCAKAERLFPLLQPGRYLALDISADFLGESLRALQWRHPSLDITGVGLDFSARLALPPGLLQGPALLFYPGSSIGNFDPPSALRLLREARELAAGGGLLIGVDLVKPVAVLERAYDDELGVTAAFNLNMLRHLNRLLGSDFLPSQWRHIAFFNAERSCIEMHLEARQNLVVRWHGAERSFAGGERIHTEDSRKWQLAGFRSLLQQAGFGRMRVWEDDARWFAVLLATER